MSKTEGPFDVRRACSKILIEQNRLERAAADANKTLKATKDRLTAALLSVKADVGAMRAADPETVKAIESALKAPKTADIEEGDE